MLPGKKVMLMNNLVAIYCALALPILLAVLFFISGGHTPLSGGVFAQPYYGENSAASLAIAAVALVHAVLFHILILPLFLGDPNTHPAALASSEMTAMLGFALGLINLNFWSALPYFAVSFANFAYAYVKIARQG